MIEIFLAAGSVAVLFIACMGAGAATLQAVGVSADLDLRERMVWGFPVGLGVLGWIAFIPAAFGFLTTPVLIAICVAGLAGLKFLTPNSVARPEGERWDSVAMLLLAVLGFVLCVDLLEGLSPPADADTLAFHFTLPKWHLAEGGLVMVPRAVDGILPQLIQMSYVLALGLGGEKALPLWTMLSGWATAALIYVMCRRPIGRNWSLAISIAYLSTPVVLQTGGAGYVEPRTAQFVLIAVVAAGLSVCRNSVAHAQLAGLCAGFFAASKYTGLLFCFSIALVMLLGAGRWRRLMWFCTVGFVAGIQWYIWIWYQTGDPVFPMLYNVLGADPGLWSSAQNAIFHGVVERLETPLPATFWWFLAYPFYVTFVDVAALENGRTGLGLLPVLLIPFAIGYAAFAGSRRWPSPLAVAGLGVAVFFVLWFFAGSPQRVRHLLPLLPALLLCLAVPAVCWAREYRLQAPLIGGLVLCIGFQIAGQAFFGLNYARHVFSSETRSAFLARNVPLAPFAAWITTHRQPADKILVFNRELLYLLDRPVVMSHRILRQRYNFGRLAAHPDQLFREMKDDSITHILAPGKTSDGTDSAVQGTIRRLVQHGCLSLVQRREVVSFGSRTVRGGSATRRWYNLYRLTNMNCRLKANAAFSS